ncbi:MAG: Rid family detoxifying hydrolase [Terriglobales bacterium]|jgi:2-iminobutanoate/2-iminopropanoate deaminase
MVRVTQVWILFIALAASLASAQSSQVKSAASTDRSQIVFTNNGPRPVGPYSQAVVAGGLVYVAGQTALDPATGKLVEGDIAAQTDRVMTNITAILAAGGSSLDRVVRTTVYLRSASDFSRMNQVYGKYFPSNPPARSTVIAEPPLAGALIEIDVIALK